MKKIIFILILGSLFTQLDAQINDAFSFQGIILDDNGNPSGNQKIEMTSAIANSSNGQEVIYTEVHDITTDNKGLFDIAIGAGIPLSGQFSDVEWLSYVPYLQVTYKLNDGADDITIPWTKFKSVPFCFSSKFIVCSDGIDGASGPQGNAGAQGPQGANGLNGINADQSNDGTNGIPVLPLLSTAPTTNIREGSIYMDDGTNRDDTLPGFRYYTGSEWIDL